jgi:hypothetical protein
LFVVGSDGPCGPYQVLASPRVLASVRGRSVQASGRAD